MLNRLEFILAALEDSRPAGLMLVAHHEGSTPGRTGFSMAVTADGKRIGTIGGGAMEHKLTEQMRTMLADPAATPQLIAQVHHRHAPPEQQSGMICAGTQRIVMCPLFIHSRKTIVTAIRRIRDGEGGSLVFTGIGVHIETDTVGQPQLIDNEEQWAVAAPLMHADTVYVVGSGHVGLAVCRAMASLDFRVVAFDHRPDVDTVRENTFAGELHIGPYEKIAGHIAPGPRAWVVVVTTAYPSDLEALRAILPLEVRYIGLMGSAAKIGKIYGELKNEGYDEADLRARIHAPIGLPLNDRTPAEIAISIAAQIISIRNSD